MSLLISQTAMWIENTLPMMDFVIARCRHLGSTRRPWKTKKTKKCKRNTVREQCREPGSPRGKTQPAARELERDDEAHVKYFRKKGEPQRRLAADPGQGDSQEDIT